MREQVLLLTIIVIIAMKLFAQEDKLKNYDTFQTMVYSPIEQEQKEDSPTFLPSVGDLNKSPNAMLLDYIQSTGVKHTVPKIDEASDKPPFKNDLRYGFAPQGILDFYKTKMSEMSTQPSNLNGNKLEIPEETATPAAKGIHVNIPNDKLFKLSMKAIGQVETGNKGYSFMRWDTGKNGGKGSGAWGRYQFIGNDHRDEIKKVTGLSLEQFLKNDKAQDKYFAHHYKKNLMPLFKKARASGLVDHLSDVEIMGGLHFRMNDFLKMYKNGTASAKAINNPRLTEHVAKIRKAAYGS